MKHRIYIILLAIATCSVAMAQGGLDLNLGNDGGSNASAGKLTASLLMGRSAFFGLPALPPAPGSNSFWTVSSGNSYLTQVSTTNEASNMMGAEFRYFLSDKMAVKASGGAIFRNSPGVTNIPSENDGNAPNATWIPAYSSITSNKETMVNAAIGIEFQKETRFSRLFPYYGVNVPFFYGRSSQFDPGIIFFESGNNVTIQPVDIGWRHGEHVAFGLQLVAGFDYYVVEGLFIGFEIKPASYFYSFQTVAPGSGLPSLQNQATTIGVFTQPLLKFGFRF